MRNIKPAPKPDIPAFFDLVITKIQDTLVSELPWLDHAFGKAQELVRTRDNRDYRYPGVYVRRDEYQNVEPNQGLGNYSFFVLNDPQQVERHQNQYGRVTADCALILWVDLSKVGSDIEAVKAEVLGVLKRMRLVVGNFTVNTISEKARNVFREYSLKEVESQFMMYPYAGLRFDGEMTFLEQCNS